MAATVRRWVRSATAAYRPHGAPVTFGVLGIIIGIFAMEVAYTAQTGVPGTDVFATGLFGVAPWVAWPLAPVLHRGLLHVISSVVGVWLLGTPVERSLERWQYAGLLVASGYLATGTGAVVLLMLGDRPVAFYGSSGIVYALGGFSLAFFPRATDPVGPAEWLAATMGGLAFLTLAVDPFTGVFLQPHWLNGGHLGGFAFGGAVGLWRRWSGRPSVSGAGGP
ncbi:MAG: rhomboid family intramembrane serine protease [Halodesulfurarchaeum sp.]